jgi:hypothetical protein
MRHLKHLFLELLTLLLLLPGTAAGCLAVLAWNGHGPGWVRHRMLWTTVAVLGLAGALLARSIDRYYRRKLPHRVRKHRPHPAPELPPEKLNPLAELPPPRK